MAVADDAVPNTTAASVSEDAAEPTTPAALDNENVPEEPAAPVDPETPNSDPLVTPEPAPQDPADPVSSEPETPAPDPATPPGVDSEEEHEDGGHEGDGHGDGGSIPDGVTITVDGRDISSTDPADSLPKIAGCSFDITMAGLNADPADSVGVKVIAWPPTVTEETRVTLVDVTDTSADGAWSGVFPLDEAVQQFERKGNGYHMRLELFINGDKAAMKMYWLGCGEPQTGNPRRMLFELDWFDSTGDPYVGDPDAVLPKGWRDALELTASGERGTASCAFPAGQDVLLCTYDNPGHGDQPGLVLPGKPGTTYTVDLAGVPDGWLLDVDTVGTFVADETCPKGAGGHHEEEATAEEDEHTDGHGEGTVCTHTVTVTRQAVEPPPDDEGGGGANPPAEEGDNPTAGEPSTNGALPLTGASVLPALVLASLLVLMGAALLSVSRAARSH
jgi:hypothetical protein